MENARSHSDVVNAPRLGRDHPWLGALIERLDRYLRRRQGVSEFTQSPDCVFRIQVARSDADVTLSDGTAVRTGDRIISLHFWNEQIPPLPSEGATIGWARRMNHAVDVSLRELARHLASRPDLADVRAIRGDMCLGGPAQTAQSVRLACRFGFERVPQRRSSSPAARLHQFGENILISLMVLARNEQALRSDSLRRRRTLVYLSRRRLEQRYGTNRPPCELGQVP